MTRTSTIAIEETNLRLRYPSKAKLAFIDYCRLMAGKPMSRYCHRPVSRLSVVCLSVTFVHCGQTAKDSIIILSEAARASIWLRRAPNSIEIGRTAFEQWRSEWTHLIFRAANIDSSFKTVRDRCMVTMKHYWEVDIGLSEFDLG